MFYLQSLSSEKIRSQLIVMSQALHKAIQILQPPEIVVSLQLLTGHNTQTVGASVDRNDNRQLADSYCGLTISVGLNSSQGMLIISHGTNPKLIKTH